MGSLLTVHHIVADGWSLGIFFRELAMLYPAFAAGQPSSLPIFLSSMQTLLSGSTIGSKVPLRTAAGLLEAPAPPDSQCLVLSTSLTPPAAPPAGLVTSLL